MLELMVFAIFVVVVVIPAIILGFNILIACLDGFFKMIDKIFYIEHAFDSKINRLFALNRLTPNKFDFWINRYGNTILVLHGIVMVVSMCLISFNPFFVFLFIASFPSIIVFSVLIGNSTNRMSQYLK